MEWDVDELIEMLDRHDPWHAEKARSVCPMCGEVIEPDEHVETVGGREGPDAALTATSPMIRTYHPRCRQKRVLVERAVRNSKLDHFGVDIPERVTA